jgi:hypothetical protein
MPQPNEVKDAVRDHPTIQRMQERHVNIFSVGGKNVVWPPYLLLKWGETVVFRAVNTPVTMHLPMPALLGHWPEKNEETIATLKTDGIMFKIPAGGLKRFRVRDRKFDKKLKKWIKDNKLSRAYPTRTVCAYSAFCEEVGDFAEGNSSPVMILEPPDPPPSKKKPDDEQSPP